MSVLPLQAWTGPRSCRKLRLEEFVVSRHIKAVRLSALCTGCLYTPVDIAVTHFFWRRNQPRDHSVAGRIKSLKNPSDRIGNQTCDLLACSTVHQSVVLPHTPLFYLLSLFVFQSFLETSGLIFNFVLPCIIV